MPVLSVIVPIYGVESYIEKCVRSLLEQTLTDIEYIFVNDCTEDRSMAILKGLLSEYPNRFNQVKIVNHDHNRGLPRARRTGLSYATGDYIIHCDSDDWVDESLYEEMYRRAVEDNADLVVCDLLFVGNNDAVERVGCKSCSRTAFIRELFAQDSPVCVMNKMFRREVYLHDITYPTSNMGEDLALTLQLVYYCEKICHVCGPKYCYNTSTSSISRQVSKGAVLNKARQACENAGLVTSFYDRHGRDEFGDGITSMKFLQRKKYMPIINHKEAFAEWKTTFPEINCDVVFRGGLGIGMKDRVLFVLTLIGVFPLIKKYTRKNIE